MSADETAVELTTADQIRALVGHLLAGYRVNITTRQAPRGNLPLLEETTSEDDASEDFVLEVVLFGELFMVRVKSSKCLIGFDLRYPNLTYKVGDNGVIHVSCSTDRGYMSFDFYPAPVQPDTISDQTQS